MKKSSELFFLNSSTCPPCSSPLLRSPAHLPPGMFRTHRIRTLHTYPRHFLRTKSLTLPAHPPPSSSRPRLLRTLYTYTRRSMYLPCVSFLSSLAHLQLTPVSSASRTYVVCSLPGLLANMCATTKHARCCLVVCGVLFMLI